MSSAAQAFTPTVIRASAGSGKTFALSNRFISLVAHGERPDKILATTFTRKAAGEILERVYQRLAAAALGKAAAQELGAQIGKPGFTPQDAAEVLERLVRSQARLTICTLDSFFVSIAQSFSFELGLIPGWVLSDADDDSRLIRDSITDLCRNADPRELGQLFLMLNRGNTRTAIHTQLEREIAELYSTWHGSTGAVWDWLDVPKGLSDEELSQAIAAIAALKAPETKKGGADSNWKNALTQAQQQAQAKNWDYFLENGICSKILAGEKTFNRHSILPEHEQAFHPLIVHLKSFYLGRLRAQNQASCMFLERFAEQFERCRQMAQLLSFSGVKQALSSAQVLEDLSELYYRLDSRIAHVLLDEFQDTSRDEWQVLEPMVAEILSKTGPEHSFFCVGDTKQAIYGWRGGVAEIFEKLEDSFPILREAVQHRDESRRSAPEIIEAVNTVFTRINFIPAASEYSDIFAAWDRRFKRHTTAITEDAGYVELRAVPKQDEDQEPFQALLEAAADRVSEIVNASPGTSIAVLLRRNDSVTEMLEALWERDIRASGEGGNPLTDSWHVCLLLSALRLAEHPADSVSGFLVSQSKLGRALGIETHSDAAAIESSGIRMRFDIATRGLGEVLRDWCKALAPEASAHDRQRMDQLVGLAYLYRPGRGKRLTDFADWVAATPVENPSASPVRVMTIHKSKGLEFDVVVLPELGERIPKSQPDSLLVLRESAASAPRYISRYAEKAIRHLDPRLQKMHEQMKAREVEESLAVLYVAMTRARFGLFMLVEEQPKDYLSFATILRQTLAPKESDDVVLFSSGKCEFADKAQQSEARPEAESRQEPQQSLALARSARGRRRGVLTFLGETLEDGSSIDLASHLKLQNQETSKTDGLLSRLCHGIEWLASANPSAGIFVEILGENLANSMHAEEAVKLFMKLISSTAGSRIFIAPAAAVELHRNLPIAIRNAEGIVSGRIHRLIVELKAGTPQRAWLYQFSTESPPKDAPVLNELQRAGLQSYRQAAARFAGLDLHEVEAHVVLLREARVV